MKDRSWNTRRLFWNSCVFWGEDGSEKCVTLSSTLRYFQCCSWTRWVWCLVRCILVVILSFRYVRDILHSRQRQLLQVMLTCTVRWRIPHLICLRHTTRIQYCIARPCLPTVEDLFNLEKIKSYVVCGHIFYECDVTAFHRRWSSPLRRHVNAEECSITWGVSTIYGSTYAHYNHSSSMLYTIDLPHYYAVHAQVLDLVSRKIIIPRGNTSGSGDYIWPCTTIHLVRLFIN